MQLIMDTEPAADIQEKMSSLEETLDTLKGTIEIKNDIANGNKENIESKKNIIENITDTVNGNSNGDNKKTMEETSIIPEPAQTKTLGKVSATEEQSECTNEQNNIETTNGTHTTTETGNHSVEEHEEKANIPEEMVVPDNLLNKLELKDVENETGNKEEPLDVKVKVLDNIETDIVKDNIANTSLSNKPDSNACINDAEKATKEESSEDVELIEPETDVVILDDSDVILEPTKSDTEKAISDEVNNMYTETTKCEIAEKPVKVNNALILEQPIIDVHNVVSVEKECLKSDAKILNIDAEKSTDNVDVGKEKNLINSETENNTKNNIEGALKAEIKSIIKAKTLINELETFDVDTDEPAVNEDITKTLEILDSEIAKTTEITNSAINTAVVDLNAEKENATEINLEKEQRDTLRKSDKNSEVSAVDKNYEVSAMECDVTPNETIQENIKDTEEVLNIDKFLKDTEVVKEPSEKIKLKESEPVQTNEPKKAPICKLSNTLDILSDDDEEPPKTGTPKKIASSRSISTEKQCISVEDDDDIMLIDEDVVSKDNKTETTQVGSDEKKEPNVADLEKTVENTGSDKEEQPTAQIVEDSSVPEAEKKSETDETKTEEVLEVTKEEPKKPLLAENFLKSYKKNLADMTREELEEFCILKIVEGIVDRSNLTDIKSKLKTMTQNIEEFKKKAMMLTKQNRDLQLVLKSVQEEQKKKTDTAIVPLKITRSVGMQVLMTEKLVRKKGMSMPTVMNANSNSNNKVATNRTPNQSPRPQKTAPNNQNIPVPRLVPVAPANQTVKATSASSQANINPPKTATQPSGINGMKGTSPVQKTAEKRTFNRTQSVTVDLTDDEPPVKVTPRSSPAPPVRLVSPQNLLARPQFTQSLNSPRKVYIPISGPQSQNIRPGQTIMLKSVPPPGQRVRGPAPHAPRMPQNQVRLTRMPSNRHPAPLPECMKQYQPPNWKALPPPPDLKLSKVENGIVISWKIEGYQEDSYEEIASYQLYAYQETSSPPSTALWKKIGDVKALPLPMACTLTQFMAGFKYYFAVRAVDIRSRLGPFSLPGSILLLNKM